MFGTDPVPSYNENEFPAYRHTEADLSDFLKAHSVGDTLIICPVGVKRSGYVKRVAEEAGIKLAMREKSLMVVDLMVAVAGKTPNFNVVAASGGESQVNIPGVGSFNSLIMVVNEFGENDIANGVKTVLERHIPVSTIFMEERDVPRHLF